MTEPTGKLNSEDESMQESPPPTPNCETSPESSLNQSMAIGREFQDRCAGMSFQTTCKVIEVEEVGHNVMYLLEIRLTGRGEDFGLITVRAYGDMPNGLATLGALLEHSFVVLPHSPTAVMLSHQTPEQRLLIERTRRDRLEVMSESSDILGDVIGDLEEEMSKALNDEINNYPHLSEPTEEPNDTPGLIITRPNR